MQTLKDLSGVYRYFLPLDFILLPKLELSIPSSLSGPVSTICRTWSEVHGISALRVGTNLFTDETMPSRTYGMKVLYLD